MVVGGYWVQFGLVTLRPDTWGWGRLVLEAMGSTALVLRQVER